ncbi:hypothetical protein RRSWK_06705 [Rhodopirellula sp. SWK7]|nr:hypothetical protein RRSWK_06705 [Rhodopirellula sp. SWK7]
MIRSQAYQEFFQWSFSIETQTTRQHVRKRNEGIERTVARIETLVAADWHG